jgi:hypothetical protein
MKGNRKAAEAEALSWVKDVDKTGRTVKWYQERFAEMTDVQFEKWIGDLENERDYLCIITDNMGGESIDIKNNLEVAKKRGVPMFERLWLTDPKSGQRYLSNVPYPIVYLPIKRQIESIENKRSIPKISSKKKDDLTGQVSGDGAAMALSQPETQILYPMGLEAVVVESLKYRGGDIKGGDEFDRSLIESGEVSINNLLQTSTKVKSTQTLKAFLIGMNYDNNL